MLAKPGSRSDSIAKWVTVDQGGVAAGEVGASALFAFAFVEPSLRQ